MFHKSGKFDTTPALEVVLFRPTPYTPKQNLFYLLFYDASLGGTAIQSSYTEQIFQRHLVPLYG